MHDAETKPYRIEGSAEYNEVRLPHQINRFVTYQIPETETERRIVLELQSQKCTKTCKKKGPECRFGFPRLPSNETVFSSI